MAYWDFNTNDPLAMQTEIARLKAMGLVRLPDGTIVPESSAPMFNQGAKLDGSQVIDQRQGGSAGGAFAGNYGYTSPSAAHPYGRPPKNDYYWPVP